MPRVFRLAWPDRTFWTREQPVRVSSRPPLASRPRPILSTPISLFFFLPPSLSPASPSTVLKPRRLCLQLRTNRQRIITGQRVFNLPYTYLSTTVRYRDIQSIIINRSMPLPVTTSSPKPLARARRLRYHHRAFIRLWISRTGSPLTWLTATSLVC